MQTFSIKDATIIMASGNFGVSYEPMKDTQNLQTLFFYAESILKKFQLQHKPMKRKLFLNLDSDTSLEGSQIEFLVNLFHSYQDIIIEIIENSDDENIKDVENFMEWMDTYSAPYAYNDFGKPNTLFFASLLNKSDYIKPVFFLKAISAEVVYIEVLKRIVQFAKSKNKFTVLEGLETKEDLGIAKEININYAQGHLFKNEFISV